MNIQERKNRVIAQGEHSDHCHVAVGDVEVIREQKGDVYLEVGNEGATLKHLIESHWFEGTETWTEEHKDISLKKGKYKYVPQVEFDPFDKIVRKVMD